MQHMAGENIGLVICRLTMGGMWSHCFVSGHPADDSYISNKSKERAYLFPLNQARSDADTNEEPPDANGGDLGWTENFSAEFRSFIDSRYEHHYAPEEILGYVYAVLYSPTYRVRFAEFLRIDFPRVPFPENSDDFETLSTLGWALVQTHLLRESPGRGLAAYHGKGDHTVEAVRYSPEEEAIHISKTQRFEPVPQDVWDFHIGSYRVLDKYLKSRKGRTLSLDEIDHVGAVADALAFTIEQMEKIDVAYRAAFESVDKSESALASRGH